MSADLPQTGERWRATAVFEGVVTATNKGYFSIQSDEGGYWSWDDDEFTNPGPSGWTFEKVTPPLPTTPGSTVRCWRFSYFLTDSGWVSDEGEFVSGEKVQGIFDGQCTKKHDIFDAGAQQ